MGHFYSSTVVQRSWTTYRRWARCQL